MRCPLLSSDLRQHFWLTVGKALGRLPLPFCHLPKGERHGSSVVEAVTSAEVLAVAAAETRTLSTRETEELLLAWVECASAEEEEPLLRGVPASRKPTFATSRLSLPVGARPLLAVVQCTNGTPQCLTVLRRCLPRCLPRPCCSATAR